MSPVDVTVCIAAWNNRELTLACLESLFACTRKTQFEVILVDNGSTDDTFLAVRSAFPQVRIVRNTGNEGFAFASNQSLRLASGRYALLLNNDTTLRMDALSCMVEFMDKNQEVGVLGCRLRFPDGTVQASAHDDLEWYDYACSALYLHRMFSQSRFFGRINCSYLDYESRNLVVEVGWLTGAVLMVRTSSLKEVGLLDERIFTSAEDWEWCRRYARNGYRVVYFGGAEVIHHHGMSASKYCGPAQHAVRKRWFLCAAASTLYVYRKLHIGSPLSIILFDLCFRLHSLSRAIAAGLQLLVAKGTASCGAFAGYLQAAFLPYRILRRSHLRG